MGTPRLFDQTLKTQLQINAAWVPVTNTFKLGDYGVMSEGIFVKIGNIESDFGIMPEADIGPNLVLNFTSKGTNLSRVAANAVVNAFPDSDADAKLLVEFSMQAPFCSKLNSPSSRYKM